MASVYLRTIQIPSKEQEHTLETLGLDRTRGVSTHAKLKLRFPKPVVFFAFCTSCKRNQSRSVAESDVNIVA